MDVSTWNHQVETQLNLAQFFSQSMRVKTLRRSVCRLKKQQDLEMTTFGTLFEAMFHVLIQLQKGIDGSSNHARDRCSNLGNLVKTT